MYMCCERDHPDNLAEYVGLCRLNATKCKCSFFVFPYVSLSWCIVEPAGIKLVVWILSDVGGVENGENGAQGPSVPVVCHAASIVALTSHVTEGIKRYFLQETIRYFTQEANNNHSVVIIVLVCLRAGKHAGFHCAQCVRSWPLGD